jgi:hypothetical protein
MKIKIKNSKFKKFHEDFLEARVQKIILNENPQS